MNKASVWLSAGIMMLAGTVWGVQRGAVQNVQPTFLETGNGSKGLRVLVGSTTPVLVYTPSTPVLVNYPTSDRVLTLEQFTPFKLFCSTSTGFTASSGLSWVVFSSAPFVTNTLVPTFCLFEAGGSTQPVYGKVDFDTAD